MSYYVHGLNQLNRNDTLLRCAIINKQTKFNYPTECSHSIRKLSTIVLGEAAVHLGKPFKLHWPFISPGAACNGNSSSNSSSSSGKSQSSQGTMRIQSSSSPIPTTNRLEMFQLKLTLQLVWHLRPRQQTEANSPKGGWPASQQPSIAGEPKHSFTLRSHFFRLVGWMF